MFVLLTLVTLPAMAQEPATAPEVPAVVEAIKAGNAAWTAGDKEGALASWLNANTIAAGLPAEDLRRYEILKLLAGAQAALKKWEDAEASLQLAINWRETAISREDPKIADDLTQLAVICGAKGDPERGLTILQRVLGMKAAPRGSNFVTHPVADVFHRMADLRVMTKDFDRAAADVATAVTIREQLLGAEHPGLAVELEKQGGILNMARSYEHAERVFRRALLLRDRSAGKEEDSINALDGLGYACFGQKKYEPAEANWIRMLGVWKRTAGAEHPMVALTLDKLTVLYRDQKKLAEAQAAADEAMAVRAHFLASGMNREAGNQYMLGNRKEAERLWREARKTIGAAVCADCDELREDLNKKLAELAPPKPVKPSSKGAKKAANGPPPAPIGAFPVRPMQ
jgi:tetratricopeptide (TPR) repeat protein